MVKAALLITSAPMDGSRVKVKWTTHGDYNPQTSIFIKHLPESINEMELAEELGQYGIVLSLMIL